MNLLKPTFFYIYFVSFFPTYFEVIWNLFLTMCRIFKKFCLRRKRNLIDCALWMVTGNNIPPMIFDALTALAGALDSAV